MKLPNRLYIEYSRKKYYAGVKQIKDKQRVTIMILTAANDKKYSLSLVGSFIGEIQTEIKWIVSKIDD